MSYGLCLTHIDSVLITILIKKTRYLLVLCGFIEPYSTFPCAEQLYSGTTNHIRSLLRIFEVSSRGILMKLWLYICRIKTVVRGPQGTTSFDVEFGEVVEPTEYNTFSSGNSKPAQNHKNITKQ